MSCSQLLADHAYNKPRFLCDPERESGQYYCGDILSVCSAQDTATADAAEAAGAALNVVVAMAHCVLLTVAVAEEAGELRVPCCHRSSTRGFTLAEVRKCPERVVHEPPLHTSNPCIPSAQTLKPHQSHRT